MTDQAMTDALPSYDIGGELGRGSWGVVLAGRHRSLGRDVAIKQLPAEFASNPSVRRRFAAEARVLASLDHPHVVPVYDFVDRDGLCLLVMEHLGQGTIHDRLHTTGFSPTAAVAVVLAGAAGLHAAHERGVLHRDVKPANMMFSGTGTVKVTDFGIAKVVGGADTMVTRAGEVVGTPAYIAPEQARGGTLTAATDVYALATMLYELLAGVLPFVDDGDGMALLFKHVFEAPTPLRDAAPSVPDAVAAVIMAGLATDPAQRIASAEVFGTALTEAATESWGPGWLTGTGVPVLGAGAILSSAHSRGPGSVVPPPPAPGGAAAPAPASPAPTGAAPPPADPVVSQPAALDQSAQDELIPARDLVATQTENTHRDLSPAGSAGAASTAAAPNAPQAGPAARETVGPNAATVRTPPPGPPEAGAPASGPQPDGPAGADPTTHDPDAVAWWRAPWARAVGVLVLVVVLVVLIVVLAPKIFKVYGAPVDPGRSPVAVALPTPHAAVAPGPLRA